MGDYVTSVEELRAIYQHEPSGAAVDKVSPVITPHYRTLIGASPFAVLATAAPHGVNCTPRGDAPGFVQVRDERTLVIPDRRGNNRLDALTDILREPRMGIIFLIPGITECVRAMGTGRIVADPDRLAEHAVRGAVPMTLIEMQIETIFFQCSRALLRSKLWDPARQVDRKSLPGAGDLVAERGALTAEEAQPYSDELDERLRANLY